MRHAPQHYRYDSDARNEPLHPAELILHGADRHDGGAAAGLEGDEEEDPDEEDGDEADGEGDEEPDAPGGLGAHVLQGDDVLRGGDRGGHAAEVAGEGDAEDEGFAEVGVGGEIAEEWLMKFVRFVI